MDGFLDFLGLYRSDVAKDGTCLYRAVSEQLFYTQKHHEDLKKSCILYMQRHRESFEYVVDNYDEYLDGLSNYQEWAGPMVMRALARKYRVDFILYQEVGKPPVKATNVGSDKKIILAEFAGNRYDCVYTKDYLSASAVCQSIVYEVLYKDVFGFGDDIDLAVQKMLHDKAYSKQRKNSSQQSKMGICPSEGHMDYEQGTSPEIRKALAQGIPPFPYKVAKTLDRSIYRNVEFDIWNEKRKETLKNENYIIPVLSEGVKCKVTIQDEVATICYTGHVQELHNSGKITVYVEELCKKCIVSEEDIEIVPVPAYKVLTWQGGKTYRINGEQKTGAGRKKWKHAFDTSHQASALDPVNFSGQKKESANQSLVRANSFSSPRTPKKPSQKPRASFSGESYRSFSQHARQKEASQCHQSTPMKDVTGEFYSYAKQDIAYCNIPETRENSIQETVEPSFTSSGYYSASLNSSDTPDQSVVLQEFVQPANGFQARPCLPNCGGNCSMMYTVHQDYTAANTVGSASATSMPLPIPKSNASEQLQVPQYTVSPSPHMLIPVCQSTCVLYGPDGVPVPVQVWPFHSQNINPVPATELPSGGPSVFNTPPTPSQLYAQASAPAIQPYNGVMGVMASQSPAGVVNDVTAYSPYVTPPWSPSAIVPTQCGIPNQLILHHPYPAQGQQWSL